MNTLKQQKQSNDALYFEESLTGHVTTAIDSTLEYAGLSFLATIVKKVLHHELDEVSLSYDKVEQPGVEAEAQDQSLLLWPECREDDVQEYCTLQDLDVVSQNAE